MTDSKTQKLVKGLSTQTVITIISGLVEVITFSIWSRVLSKADFGYMAAINGVIAIVSCISSAGLGSAIVQKKEESSEHVSTAFTLSLILGSVASLFVFVFSPQLANMVADDTLIAPMRWMSLGLFLGSVLSVGKAQLTRKLAFGRLGIYNIIAYIISSAIGIFIALKGFGLFGLIFSSLLCTIIEIILIYVTSLKIPKIRIYKSEISGIVSFGGWLTLGSIFNMISMKIDSLFLSKWMSVEALGAYNRPAGFVSTVSTKVNGIFDTVLFPLLSSIQNDKKNVQSVLLRAIGLMNSFSVILSAVFFCNAELIIEVFFGKQWMELVPVMRIVSLSVIFNIDGRLVDCFFRSLAYVRLGCILRIFQALVSFIGLFIGVKFGIQGVAASIVIANILNILIKVISLSIKVKVPLGKVFVAWITAWKPIIGIVIISIPYFMISHSLLINIIYAVVFGLVLVWEFVLHPKSVSFEYENLAQPYIKMVRQKIIKKRT